MIYVLIVIGVITLFCLIIINLIIDTISHIIAMIYKAIRKENLENENIIRFVTTIDMEKIRHDTNTAIEKMREPKEIEIKEDVVICEPSSCATCPLCGGRS